VGPVLQYRHRRHEDRHQRWDRSARAERFEPYRALPAPRLSQRPAAQRLHVPRSTRHAWRASHERLDAGPAVGACLHRPPGLACRHRLGRRIPRGCPAVGAWGMRLGWLLVELTGLTRCVGPSDGTPPQGTRRVADALGAYRQEARARLAHERPATALPRTTAATVTGALGLGGRAPVRHAMLLAPLAAARAHDPCHACMAPALAGLHGTVRPATREAAPGLVASGAPHLGHRHEANGITG